MNQNCKSIFVYNKNNELVRFVEIFESGDIKSYYELQNRTLKKLNVFSYKEKKKHYQERNRAIISYDEDCSLFHCFLDGESRVVSQTADSASRKSPKSISKIYTTNEDVVDSFTVNKDLIKDWIKKL